MITKNYKLYCRARCLGSNLSGFVSHEGASFTYYPQNTYGQANRGDFGCYLSTVYISSSMSGGGVRFGTGTTPPTENDYKLETLITSGLSVSGTKLVAEDCAYVQASFIAHNKTDADITISEIGYFGQVPQSNTDNGGVVTLMERTVLSDPITIPPGGAKIINYRVDLYNW